MMQFGKTWKDVISGKKTATSRIVKPSHEDFPLMYPVGQMNSIGGANMEPAEGIYAVMDHNTNRTIYRVGQEVAVQPGRGVKSVGRIRITALERYDPRLITPEQVQAEGFNSSWEYLQVWTSMHDKAANWQFDAQRLDYWINTGKRRELVGWETVQEIIAARPKPKYDAWFIRFELLEVYK